LAAVTILLLQRGGAVAAGSIQETGVDDIVVGAAEAGVPAAGRSGIIGIIILTATVIVAAAATVGDVIVIVAAAGAQAGREMLAAAAA
jgi:hypothetical protein